MTNSLPRRIGFTLVELLVVIAVLAILAAMVVSVLSAARRSAKRVVCGSNLHQLATADLSYLTEYGRFPAFSANVPSSIPVARLQSMARYLGEPAPPGPAFTWPKRAEQPAWFNCPLARESGFAEGLTAGGGLYTGYVYVAGVERSQMVRIGLATLTRPNRAVDRLNQRRGVIWADILAEFKTAAPERFEFFHYRGGNSSGSFVFPASGLEGTNRAWNDGSVEWADFDLTTPMSPDRQINHVLGYYYY